MGCVVSSEGDGDERRRIIGVSAAAGSHHIVSLTSSTYGILTSPRAYSSSTCAADEISSPSTLAAQPSAPEVINSWELMAGLVDPSSTPAKARRRRRLPLRPIDGNGTMAVNPNPPNPKVGGEDGGALLYTTSLRAVRATFEACNAVRGALQAHGVAFLERDVSMDRGFRDELLRFLSSESQIEVGEKKKAVGQGLLPRLLVRGRHVGGADEVLRLDEEGKLAALLDGLPRPRGGSYSCDGCGGMRFLPCFDCSGSRKLAMAVPNNDNTRRSGLLVVRCRECNENGLVLCPICS
ncbi:hypothetical protein PR202_gb05935 [Eleusine coracana subsp. coracana]|uniref:Glutaredoxin domain-containing protein n=1 Tax=Eleusine coracana subsp. coracana TaxID=191504 RepID=A0AAV5E8A7_ELECO|nr:hypothetical protein QOZ80_2BG0151990 [Eleusine coracana subsp. coracana]GJN18739.1 hypothetical protein PR202_gb05935 [Eleusine coracana subsp. coracana]